MLYLSDFLGRLLGEKNEECSSIRGGGGGDRITLRSLELGATPTDSSTTIDECYDDLEEGPSCPQQQQQQRPERTTMTIIACNKTLSPSALMAWDDFLLFTMLQYLPAQDLLNTSLVCKQWCSVSLNDLLWREYVVHIFTEYYSGFFPIPTSHYRDTLIKARKFLAAKMDRLRDHERQFHLNQILCFLCLPCVCFIPCLYSWADKNQLLTLDRPDYDPDETIRRLLRKEEDDLLSWILQGKVKWKFM